MRLIVKLHFMSLPEKRYAVSDHGKTLYRSAESAAEVSQGQARREATRAARDSLSFTPGFSQVGTPHSHREPF
jgi:hypothetical protein